jgi:hypothetical protein
MVYSLKPKVLQVIFKNSVRTSKRTYFTITRISWLIMFKEIIAVYCENHTIHSFIIHLRFVHSTVVFLHPKLSFAICLCLWYPLLSVHSLSCSVLLHLSIFRWVFPFFAFPLVSILKFSVAVCFLAFASHVRTIVAVFLQLLLKCSSSPP